MNLEGGDHLGEYVGFLFEQLGKSKIILAALLEHCECYILMQSNIETWENILLINFRLEIRHIAVEILAGHFQFQKQLVLLKKTSKSAENMCVDESSDLGK